MMKLSIARLELREDGKKWLAHLQAPDVAHRCIWIVSNPEDIPSEVRDDGEYHLFQYDPQDQFCKYVDLAKLQEEANLMRCYLSQNDTRLPRAFCARLAGTSEW